MIFQIDGFQTKLEQNGKIYNVFTYKRLLLKPCEKQVIYLPLSVVNPDKKYINFELDKKLCLNGLQVLWTNLNEENSINGIELLIYNGNLDYELLYRSQSPLSQIIGSNNKIDLVTETLLGRILFN